MNKQRQAVVILLLMTALWGAISWTQNEWRGVIIFGAMMAGEVFMAVLLWLAQRKERNDSALRSSKFKTGWFSALMILLPGLAKAIIVIAIGVGLVVGLAGWAAIKIWSKALSIQYNQLRKPADVAMGSVTQPPVIVAAGVAAAPPEPEPEFNLANDNESPEDYTGLVLNILVPSNTILEYSTDMQHWTEIHASGSQAVMTFWEPQGEKGFFRLKSWQTGGDVPPTAIDPTL